MGVLSELPKAQKVEVKEQDFNIEISGNDLVYSMATKWAAAGEQGWGEGWGGGKIVGMKNIKEPRGQAAGRVARVDIEVLELLQEGDSE